MVCKLVENPCSKATALAGNQTWESPCTAGENSTAEKPMPCEKEITPTARNHVRKLEFQVYFLLCGLSDVLHHQ